LFLSNKLSLFLTIALTHIQEHTDDETYRMYETRFTDAVDDPITEFPKLGKKRFLRCKPFAVVWGTINDRLQCVCTPCNEISELRSAVEAYEKETITTDDFIKHLTSYANNLGDAPEFSFVVDLYDTNSEGKVIVKRQSLRVIYLYIPSISFSDQIALDHIHNLLFIRPSTTSSYHPEKKRLRTTSSFSRQRLQIR